MSRLAGDLPGSTVLDLFAGSGALGLEALSRGAAHVTFVEVARASLEALRANVAALDVEDRITIRRGDALAYAELTQPGEFDIAFADPPYTTGQAERLSAIFQRRAFARLLGVEHAGAVTLPGGETRTYGNVALTFFRAP